MESKNESIFGDWKQFTIKLIEPEHHPQILEHLRDYFCYPAMYRLNYDKSMDDECIAIFKKVLESDGPKLSIFAQDKATGKVAGTRIVTLKKKNPGPEDDFSKIQSTILRSIVKFYQEVMKDGRIFEKFPKYDVLPEMFGLSTATEFQKQGLGTEMYRRSKLMLKNAGYDLALVGFISPYSRAAGKKNGFIETSRRLLVSALNDETGEPLKPDAEEGSYMDMGYFVL